MQGADDLGVLAKRLKEVGDKELRKELLRGIRVATKDTKAAIKANALRQLPKRGGLNVVVANSKFTTKTRMSARSTGIKIMATNPHSIRGMDRGKLRHRVFGTDRWVSQSIPSGWFSGPVEADAPKVQAEIGKAMASVAAKLERN